MLLFYILSTVQSVKKKKNHSCAGLVALNVRSKNVLNKVVNVCGKVVHERQEHLSQLYDCCVVRKAKVIVDYNSHVLPKCYELLPSGRRFCVQKVKQSFNCSQ